MSSSASHAGADLQLPSTPPPSIPAIVASARSSLVSFGDAIAVSSVLTDLTTALDAHHTEHLLSTLQSTLSSLQSTHSVQSADWAALSHSIHAATAELSTQAALLTASLSQSQAQLTALTAKLDAATHENAQFFLRLRRRTAASDLGLLPRSVQQRLVPFLRPRELARALCVCHRWRMQLDRGLHWKLLLVRVILQILQQRANQSNDAASSSPSSLPPPSFTLTFTPAQVNPRPKSLLTKADVLRHALAMHQRKVDAVMGEFEQLSNKQGDEGNEKTILRVMVDLKRDEVGRRRVMIGEMWEKAEALRVQRAGIARQLKEMEGRIGTERELKRAMRAEHAEAQRWFEGRVSRVRAIEGGGAKKEERDGLMKKNGVLHRALDHLHKDIERARQEKEEYEQMMQQLRDKIKQVVW